MEWSKQFDTAAFYDSNGYTEGRYSRFDGLAGVGIVEVLTCNAGTAFDQLQAFYDQHQDWLFGFMAYDLKNELEDLSSQNTPTVLFPDLFFFVPKIVFHWRNKQLTIASVGISPSDVFNEISHFTLKKETAYNEMALLQPSLTKAEYLDKIKQVKEEIRQGEIYEMNFCQAFSSSPAIIHPESVFTSLMEKSPTPFAAYFKQNEQYLMCASPERYLQKQGNKLISQPIKGTVKRSLDYEENEAAKKALQESKKERAENVMIVDLVRNDLTHYAKTGTIKVEELCGIHSFPKVHHLISTITAEIEEDVPFTLPLRKTYPMGSMTGCPKVRAMEIIEEYEVNRRGLYSGTVGYISPNADYDFNVVIRSLLYDKKTLNLSFQVGGAITYDSDPLSEYEECLAKAAGVLSTLDALE